MKQTDFVTLSAWGAVASPRQELEVKPAQTAPLPRKRRTLLERLRLLRIMALVRRGVDDAHA